MHPTFLKFKSRPSRPSARWRTLLHCSFLMLALEHLRPHGPLIVTLVLLLWYVTAPAVAQHRSDGHTDGPTAAEVALAEQLGVHPKVLMAASSLANRKPADVARLLEVNPSATLTDTGAIVFGCSLHPEADQHQHSHWNGPGAAQRPPQQQEGQDPAVLQPAPPSTGQGVRDEKDTSKALKLHSRPSAAKKIFLEFNGCVTEGTEGWNNYYNISKITTPAYDTDGNTDWFSQDELRDIITIHGAVAEAYAPWDVDVTTENPGFDGLERSDELDEHYGIRMCVGGDSYWTNTSIGGIASLNSFGWINNGSEVYRDSFVFSLMLTERDGSMNLGYIWKSIVHEIGHTLGLVHKGFKTPEGVQEYYTIPPHPSMWAPVMGVPGRGLYAQWNNGEYPAGIESSNTDDELSIINQTLPFISNEPNASSASDPLPLCILSTCKEDSSKPGWVTTILLGSITQREDQEWYKLTVARREQFRIQLTVHGNWHQSYWDNGDQRVTWRVSNLRPEVKFESEGVKVVATTVDPWTWQQDFLVSVPQPGNYTFAVQPTQVLGSKGQAMPSSYGNLGSYQLMVAWPRK